MDKQYPVLQTGKSTPPDQGSTMVILTGQSQTSCPFKGKYMERWGTDCPYRNLESPGEDNGDMSGYVDDFKGPRGRVIIGYSDIPINLRMRTSTPDYLLMGHTT